MHKYTVWSTFSLSGVKVSSTNNNTKLWRVNKKWVTIPVFRHLGIVICDQLMFEIQDKIDNIVQHTTVVHLQNISCHGSVTRHFLSMVALYVLSVV